MNNKRRQKLRQIIRQLSSGNFVAYKIRLELAKIAREEEWAMENVPESLQETERYQTMEESYDFLQDAVSEFESEREPNVEYVIETLEQIDGV